MLEENILKLYSTYLIIIAERIENQRLQLKIDGSYLIFRQLAFFSINWDSFFSNILLCK